MTTRHYLSWVIAFLLALPMASIAQVERIEQPSPDSWAYTRVHSRNGPVLTQAASGQGLETLKVGDHLYYKAELYRDWAYTQAETWVIDSTGQLRVAPRVERMYPMGPNKGLALQNDQMAVLDPVSLTVTPLVPGASRLMQGLAEDGRQLMASGGGTYKTLWCTDGTADGTVLLMDSMRLSFSFEWVGNASYVLDNTWVFVTDDHKAYSTDGTPEGTRLLRTFPAAPRLLGLVPGVAIFLIEGAFWSLRLSDGNLSRYFIFAEHGIQGMAQTRDWALVNRRLVLRLVHQDGRNFLWATDGTAAGTRNLAQAPTFSFASIQNSLMVIGEEAYFMNRSPYETGMLATNGTPAGTRVLASDELGILNLSGPPLPWGQDRYAIVAYGRHAESGLWLLGEGFIRDCTPWPGYGGGLRAQGTVESVNHRVGLGQQHLYFSAQGVGVGRELHRTDRQGRTELVADLMPGAAWADVAPIGQVGHWFYFVHNHPQEGIVMYRVRDDQPLPEHPEPSPTFYDWQQGLMVPNRHTGFTNNVWARDMVVGQDQAVYTAGHYSGPHGIAFTNDRQVESRPSAQHIQDLVLHTKGAQYLAKLDGEDGSPNWIQTLGSSAGPLERLRLSPAPEEGVYVAGKTATEGMSALTMGQQVFNVPRNHSFVARINGAGQGLWCKALSGAPSVQAMATDGEGALFALLFVNSPEVIVDGTPFEEISPASTQEGRWAMAKINPDGTVAWAKVLYLQQQKESRKWETSILALAPDGRILIALNEVHPPSERDGCGREGSLYIKILTFSPEGLPLWERSFPSKGGYLVSDMAVNSLGQILLAGFGRGDIAFGHLARKRDCEQWRSFVLTMGPLGEPLSLNDFDDEELFVYQIRSSPSGAYAVAGLAGAVPRHIPYPELASQVPYRLLLFRAHILRHYSARHEAMGARQWQSQLQGAGPVSLPENTLRLAHYHDEEFIVQDRYSGPLDTLAHSPALRNTAGAMLMRVPFEALPPDIVVDDVPFSWSAVEAFPNPVRNVLTLSSPHAAFQTAELYLFNSIGQSVAVQNMPAFGAYRHVNMTGLPAGVYFLGVRQGEHWEMQRVVLAP